VLPKLKPRPESLSDVIVGGASKFKIPADKWQKIDHLVVLLQSIGCINKNNGYEELQNLLTTIRCASSEVSDSLRRAIKAKADWESYKAEYSTFLAQSTTSLKIKTSKGKPLKEKAKAWITAGIFQVEKSRCAKPFPNRFPGIDCKPNIFTLGSPAKFTTAKIEISPVIQAPDKVCITFRFDNVKDTEAVTLDIGELIWALKVKQDRIFAILNTATYFSVSHLLNYFIENLFDTA